MLVRGKVSGRREVRASVQLSVRTSLVWQWAHVAVEHEREAWQARGRLKASIDNGDGPEGSEHEMRASMVAIAAAAFAIDGLYGEHQDVVPEATREAWKEKRTARWKQIHETLRLALRVPRATRDELAWLFGREELGRDYLVHPDPDSATRRITR